MYTFKNNIKGIIFGVEGQQILLILNEVLQNDLWFLCIMTVIFETVTVWG